MNRVYRVAGISKQGFHQRLDRMLGKLELRAQLLPLLVQVRKDHPEMSARSIYQLLRPKGIGREQFIQWAYMNAEINSNPLDYQAPLFSPQKVFLGYQWDTLAFNLLAIWIMSIVLVGTLYFETFRKMGNLFTRNPGF